MPAEPTMPVPADAGVSPLVLNVREAAKLLSISERTLFTITKRGEMPAVRIGSRVLYDPADLANYVQRRKATASPAPLPCDTEGGAG